MPVIPLPDNAIVQVSFRSRLLDQVILNTFHYQFQGLPDPGQDYRIYLEALIAELKVSGNLYSQYLTVVPTNQLVESIRAQTVFPIRQRYVHSPENDDGTSAGGQANTANVAVSVRRVSDLIGQGGVGRVQLTVPTDYVAGGYVLSGAMPALESFAAELTQTVVHELPVASWIPVLFGKTKEGTIQTSEVIEAAPENTIRTMHRRTVRVGI